MADEIKGDVGSGEQAVFGKENLQQKFAPQQTVTFSPPGDMSMWFKILEHGAQIQELFRQMDSLPTRVDKLERVEVVVKPGPEVIVTRTEAETRNLSVRMIFVVLTVSLLVSLLVVAFLVYVQVTK